MNKKNKVDKTANDSDMLSFEPRKNVAIKKNANDIMNLNAPSFYVSDKPILSNRQKFDDIRNAIHNLEIGKYLIITNENTGLTINELKQKISNIVFGHARKHTEKQFTTSKIDNKTFSITRNKDKTK